MVSQQNLETWMSNLERLIEKFERPILEALA